MATTAPMANPNAGSESCPCRIPCANSKTAAIAAARNTEGEGLTSAINAVREIAVATNR